MSEVPDPLRRLNLLLDAMLLAHTAVYGLHRTLVSINGATPASRGLLAESAEIVLQRTPEASATARRLASRWHEQSVFDPQAAEETARELEGEITQAESVLRELLTRETAIAAQLRAMASDGG